jgi:hypothetical protein
VTTAADCTLRGGGVLAHVVGCAEHQERIGGGVGLGVVDEQPAQARLGGADALLLEVVLCNVDFVPGERLAALPDTELRAIGPRMASRYFLTAERFDALEALRIGLVHEVVAPEALTVFLQGLERLISDQSSESASLSGDANAIA